MANQTLTKLHIGCFDHVLPGWINTDITPRVFLSRVPCLAWLLFKIGLLPQQRYSQHRQGVFRNVRYMNVARRFPYADGAIDYVYSSHMLEHLYPAQAVFCLSEIYRVLNTGGVNRIAVPDLDKTVASYNRQSPDQFLKSIFEVKQKNQKNQHHWHYNEISLTRILREVGFHEVYRCQFQQGHCADVTLVDMRPQSLFMEAVK